MDAAVGCAAGVGGGLLAGFLAAAGSSHAVPLACLGAILAWTLAAGAWSMGWRLARRAGCPAHRALALGALPLLPWLAAWPLLALELLVPLVHAQLLAARAPLALYLLGWLLAGLAGVALWLRAVGPREHTLSPLITDHSSLVTR
jgi:hypothetical protein